jgi:hypothetical protein
VLSRLRALGIGGGGGPATDSCWKKGALIKTTGPRGVGLVERAISANSGEVYGPWTKSVLRLAMYCQS